jgi:uncharacterized membrane protein
MPMSAWCWCLALQKGIDPGFRKGENVPNGEGAEQNPSQARPEPAGTEPVWTYRGYELRPSEFTTAMVHLFRAEVQRANVWRQRLDTTTNWAVLTTGAAISFAFSRTMAEDHRVLILNVLLVTLFLHIEARRYRYYELWSSRVRLMETDFFATMLVPPFHPASDWAESLAENLLHPQFPVSMWEALGRRFRRNYMWVYIVLGIAWVFKVWLHPTRAGTWSQFMSRASIGVIPGEMVVAVGLIFNGILMLIGVLTIGLQQASGEVLPRYGIFQLPGLATSTAGPKRGPGRWRAWFRPVRRRQQLLALIITDRAQAVADRILQEMERGVTALSGTGMYTRRQHTVLMCALTMTEVAHLKVLVHAEDPKAFLTLTPAQEVLGKGFASLQEETGSEEPVEDSQSGGERTPGIDES